MSGTSFILEQSGIREVVSRIASVLTDKGHSLSVAESCTAGLIGHVLTHLPGSSAWFAGGVIAYSNRIKSALLGVEEEVLNEYGAVSRQCVLQMVRGVTDLCATQAGVAVSGIAGPGGGTEQKPVGTVYIAWRNASMIEAERFFFSGDREEVRQATAMEALKGLRDRI
jgi:nicotinamide-nucleotide amidase